jgi:hypothetical protein
VTQCNYRHFLPQINEIKGVLRETTSVGTATELLCRALLLKVWSDKGYFDLPTWQAVDRGDIAMEYLLPFQYRKLASLIKPSLPGSRWDTSFKRELKKTVTLLDNISFNLWPMAEIIDLYTKIRLTQERRRLGAFYSPPEIVDFILKHTLRPQLESRSAEEVTFLDPACGCGNFLGRAYDYFRAAYLRQGVDEGEIPRRILSRNLYGVDVDLAALQFAALLLLEKDRSLLVKDGQPVPPLNLRGGDALPKAPEIAGLSPGGFSVVAGNPPHVSNYGRSSQRLPQVYLDNLKSQYDFCRGRSSNRYNLVMFFLERFLELTASGGRAGVVVDGSSLHTTVYREIRDYLSQEALIHHLVEGLEAFSGVNSKQAILIFEPLQAHRQRLNNHRVSYRRGLEGKSHLLSQTSWQDSRWSKPVEPGVMRLIEKIGAAGEPLETLYKPHSGMNVTNRPQAGLKPFLAPEPLDHTYHKAIFSGNIFPYHLRWPIPEQLSLRSRKEKYISYDRDLALAINNYLAGKGEKSRVSIGRCEGRFRQPKLFVRQSLAGERKIVAAYSADPEEYCDNSVYLINVKRRDFSLFYLLAILNSHLITFYARHSGILSVASSGTATRLPMGGSRGVGLRQLPVPLVSSARQRPLARLARQLTKIGQNRGFWQKYPAEAQVNWERLKKEVNCQVYQLYGLAEEEIAIIEEALSD